MTRRQEITLSLAVATWLLVATLAFFAIAQARFDSDRCGRIGGCPWMQTT